MAADPQRLQRIEGDPHLDHGVSEGGTEPDQGLRDLRRDNARLALAYGQAFAANGRVLADILGTGPRVGEFREER